MRLFLDTANVNSVIDRISSGLISGITTNPSLIKKNGKNYLDVYNEFRLLGISDLSMEVVGNASQMITQGMNLYKDFGSMTTIKVPCSVDGLKACKDLSAKGIRVNVTLVFSSSQAVCSALAGATYVSPFIGRMDDNSLDGIKLINDISNIYAINNVKTKVLAASIRDAQSVGVAFGVGADICTVPPNVFDQLYKHVLTDKGIAQFEKDNEESKDFQPAQIRL
tara:strand:- start:549 stop:1217 length:669 start_codon:yes stop_codon:yes gene_type:complete